VVILVYYYFERVSERSGVSTILKGSKIDFFCLQTDLADCLAQSALGNADVKYQVR